MEKTTLDITHELADQIILKRKEYLLAKIERYPASNFRASDIHECDRYMVYSILNWNEKSLHDEGLQAIFDRGNEEERRVIMDLQELGFTFLAQQNPIEIKNNKGEIICRGKIDGKILYQKIAIPCEIKSMNMNTFGAIRSIDDLQKKPLHRKYLRQMQLYLYGNNIDAGLFILTDLQGHYKLLVVELDFGECEQILRRLEKNWKAVQTKKYPEPIDYNKAICGRCPYAHICLQPISNDGAKMIDNPELEEKLVRREELKPYVDEYEAIDEEVKGTYKGKELVIIGTSWQITSKCQKGTRIDTKAMPDEIKNQYKVPSEKWITLISRIK